MKTQFSRPQLMFMLLLCLSISNHVFIIPHLIKDAGRDAWISILMAYPALIVWTFVLFLILRSMGTVPLTQWLNEKIGKAASAAIHWGLALYFLVLGTLIVYDMSLNTKIYFLPKTPNPIIVLSFVTLSYFAARFGLKTIVYLSILLLPFVSVLGHFVSFSTMDSKDYSILKPFFSEGISADLRGAIIVFGGSIELLLLVVMQHQLKKPLNYGTILLAMTLLVALTFGPCVGSLTAFGPNIAGTLRFPAFEQWRLVSLGEYISHVDFLAVFQMMSGSITRTALQLYLISELIGIRGPVWKQVAMIVAALVMALPSLLNFSDLWVQRTIHDHFYMSSFIFGIAVILILFIVSRLPARGKVRRNENNRRNSV
ncbi:GerAB/ArcD/ProY family transporter [Cohnella phaseoli]|uniref:Spore germination protein (Amino acid permease) n=1 Tax=Cohnella phaseoli TaxID=456490 RepID=A0A3D9KSP8_9BACL|nr:endospore germination permease [Cohnella phaseoli]RED89189.1 spore germination protein (amino acid permease) [Cohnella phaseoli]